MERSIRPDSVIRDHVAYAIAAAAIPVPLADIAAVTLVQLDMVKTLARLHAVPYDEARGKAVVLSLTGASLARAGASAVKLLPLAGPFVGCVAQMALSGASTYAVGRVFVQHFAEGGTLHDLDPERLRERYDELVARGRRIAHSLGEKLVPEVEPDLDAVAATLERLARLKQTGVLTPDEFEELKRSLLNEI